MNSIEIHSCGIEKSIMSFPLGALCIKTALNSSGLDCRASVFDHYVSDNAISEARACAARAPFAVGLSLYIWNSAWFDTFASELHRINPSIVIFAGGPHCVSYNGAALPDYLSFAVMGEGEVADVQAIERIISGSSPDGIKGVVTRSNPVASFAELPDLDKLQSPFLTGAADSVLGATDSVLWEMTRGCPFSCAFCFESRGTKTVRDYPLERIEKELDYLVSHDIQNVFVLDPTFNLNAQRAKRILSMLISKAPDWMHFTFEIRAELVDEEMADMFAVLNCSLQIGLQSSDEAVLEKIGRKFDKKTFTEKVKLLAGSGAAFGLDLIIGLPGDTIKGFRNTVDFAVSLQPSNLDCFLLSLLPGTVLAKNAKELGLVPGDDLMRTVVRTSTMGEADISDAIDLRNAFDLFYTKGQACMWIHCILETLNIDACNLFSLFSKWMRQTGRTADEDIWTLQDDFITSLFEKTQNVKLLDAMKSFMELHQGLCYVTECGEPAQLDLMYSPDDLANLDSIGLKEFVKTYRKRPCNPVVCMEDGEVVFR